MQKRNSSEVWKYFIKNYNIPDEAQCKICKHSYKRANGTSNLMEHLKRKHMTILQRDKIISLNERNGEINEPNTPALLSRPSTSTFVEVERNNFQIVEPETPLQIQPMLRQKQMVLSNRFLTPSDQQIAEFYKAIVKMIAKDLQPVSIVENSGFRHLVKLLDSRYQIPSRRALSRSIIPNIYAEVKNKIQVQLNDAKYISVTTDIWTSINTDSFITITVHFFPKLDNYLKTFVLCTKKLTEGHTAVYLSEIITTELNKFDILHKVVAIVTDGGRNINAAVRLMNIQHIPCTAHKLNLVVRNALNLTDDLNVDRNIENNDDDSSDSRLKEILKKCRNIVGFFKRSEVGNRKLVEKQQQMGLQNILKLKQDVCTRWNSTLVMMERLLQLKEPITIVIMTLKEAPPNLSSDEWDVVEDCIPLLKPFHSITVELSAEEYPTISKVIPLIRGLQIALTNKDPSTIIGILLKSNLHENIRSRFQGIEKQSLVPHFGRATLLDPRCKKVAFGNEQNASDAETSITTEVASLLNIPIPEPEVVDPVQTETEDLWGFLTTKVNDIQSKSTTTSSAMVLVKQYLGMPYQELSCKLGEYWEKHKTLLYPLNEVALKYATIPATSVPSERIFSKTGQIMSARRNRLLPKNLDTLVFLNKNM